MNNTFFKATVLAVIISGFFSGGAGFGYLLSQQKPVTQEVVAPQSTNNDAVIIETLILELKLAKLDLELQQLKLAVDKPKPEPAKVAKATTPKVAPAVAPVVAPVVAPALKPLPATAPVQTPVQTPVQAPVPAPVLADPGWISAQFVERKGNGCIFEIEGGRKLAIDASSDCPAVIQINQTTGQWRTR